LDGNLRFCENQLKVSNIEGDNGVVTLMIYHDTLLKTLKKHCLNGFIQSVRIHRTSDADDPVTAYL